MTKGISLKFNDNGEAKIYHPNPENPCFGGVRCRHATEGYFCKYVQKPLAEVKNKCPINRWVKMAVPIGHQNIHYGTYK